MTGTKDRQEFIRLTLLAFVGTDTLVATVPADRVYMTYHVAVSAQKIRHAQALDPGLKIQIWLSGHLTTKTKQHLQDKRMKVHEWHAQRCCPPAMAGSRD